MTDILDPLSGALWAASRGFSVTTLDHPELPTCAGIRTGEHDPLTCTDRGKHPCEKYSQTATSDPHEIVARMSGRQRNYGIVAGRSGLLIIDDDTGDSFADFAESIGQTIPETLLILTARGLHYYFRFPAGYKPSNGEGDLPPKVNVRAGQAYAVGPGSQHSSGPMYYSPDYSAGVADCPSWLIRVLRLQPIRGKAAFSAPDPVARSTGVIPVGERHQKLVKYASRLRHRRLDLDEAVALTELRWRDCEQPPGDQYPLDRVKPLVEDIFQRYSPEDSPDAEGFELQVAAEVHRLRVVQTARDIVRAEAQPPAPDMDIALLDDITDEPVKYRVENLVPMHGNALVVAKRKSGKSTILLNLVRSLRTGDPFLGSLEVEPIAGRVAFLNYELPRGMFATWARDVGLTSDDLLAVNLRGRRNPLGNEDDLDVLKRRLSEHQVEALVVDPFSRAFAGQNINDTGEVTRFLADLDILKADIGASTIILAAHAGWSADRARNSSVLEDWPDSIITMTSDDQHRRYLSAIGRDVELDEDLLEFDQNTRTLRFTGIGSRRATTAADHLSDLARRVTEVVTEQPGLTVAEIEERLKRSGVGFQKGDISKAAKVAEGDQRLTRRKEGRAIRHFSIDIPRHTPKYPDGVHDVPQPPLYRGGVRPGYMEENMPRAEHLISEHLGGEVIA